MLTVLAVLVVPVVLEVLEVLEVPAVPVTVVDTPPVVSLPYKSHSLNKENYILIGNTLSQAHLLPVSVAEHTAVTVNLEVTVTVTRNRAPDLEATEEALRMEVTADTVTVVPVDTVTERVLAHIVTVALVGTAMAVVPADTIMEAPVDTVAEAPAVDIVVEV